MSTVNATKKQINACVSKKPHYLQHNDKNLIHESKNQYRKQNIKNNNIEINSKNKYNKILQANDLKIINTEKKTKKSYHLPTIKI